jgi:2-polyprenyl-3-methyl-5-hydroxy-6-metoxy-1,4-benzoquinol methylase
MDSPDDNVNLDALTAASRAIWNQNAAYWDDYMGPEGNKFHQLLVAPTAERLLAVRPGEVVLEIACGAGLFARRLAELGARVVATDFSDVFIERAQVRCEGYTDRIEFRVLDCTDAAGLRALGENRFDAVVANMALMDIADLRPLAATLPQLLTPSGRFVFTTAHPCFNHAGATRLAEEQDAAGITQVSYSVRVTRYLSLTVDKGLGVPGQQVAQYYFDRPLHRLLAPFLAAGLVLDGLEEPAFDESVPNRQQTRWGGSFHEIPPVLAVRLRPR